jgi:hypothetical protein
MKSENHETCRDVMIPYVEAKKLTIFHKNFYVQCLQTKELREKFNDLM